MDCYTLVVRSPKVRHAFKEAEEREIKTKKEKKQQRSGTEGLQGGQWQAVPRGTRRPGQTPHRLLGPLPLEEPSSAPLRSRLEGKENMFNQRYRTERAAGASSSGRKCARRLVLPLKEIKFMVCQISRKENPQDGNPAR